MYQPKVRHVLSPILPDATGGLEAKMWPLFVAIGAFWALGDPPEQYRVRFGAFLRDRISLNPLYADIYALADQLLTDLTAELGRDAALKQLFTNKDHRVVAALSVSQLSPETGLEFVQVYVVNEFIALRVALGGFADFGGVNYCGYFGGANVPGQPVPYRGSVIP